MSKTLTEMAHLLKDNSIKLMDTKNKVQLIYAFNGSGKTRLSREFKELIAPKIDDGEDARTKILYYNAFTEDLFYWDNDLEGDSERKLKIQPNNYTQWVLEEQGQDLNTISYFQKYTSDKLTPRFNEEYTTNDKDGNQITVKAFSEVTFSIERGDDESIENIKISKGEESNFIWSIFYSLIEQVIDVLNVAEPDDRETNQFDQLEYIFIDDPVSSLDENHIIELAVHLAGLIKSNQSKVQFIITTHNPLFYNVLYSELKLNTGHILRCHEDGTFDLVIKKGQSNTSFSYHLHIKQLIEEAIAQNTIQRYHFNLLRNLYEKAASFLGYPSWINLLPDDQETYAKRVMNHYSHRTLSSEEIAEPTEPEKKIIENLIGHLVKEHKFLVEGSEND